MRILVVIAEPGAERMGWSSCMTLWIAGLMVVDVGGLDLDWTRSLNASDKYDSLQSCASDSYATVFGLYTMHTRLMYGGSVVFS
jgi:hypothetical protein